MAKQVISEQEEQTIIEALEKAYGDQDEDWVGMIVSVKSVEKFYAVRAPSSAEWHSFSNTANLYFTKLNAQAASAKPAQIKGLQDQMLNLVADCQITDVPGVATNADLLADKDIKPRFVEKLVEKITELSESGVRQVQKKG
jgi:hypothetical protein